MIYCPICGRAYKKLAPLVKHFKIEHGELVCPICKITFKTVYDLKHHISVNARKEYQAVKELLENGEVTVSDAPHLALYVFYVDYSPELRKASIILLQRRKV